MIFGAHSDLSFVSRSAVDTDVIRELEAVEGENFTIIEAAEDRGEECLDLLEAGTGEEGGTVIEVSSVMSLGPNINILLTSLDILGPCLLW